MKKQKKKTNHQNLIRPEIKASIWYTVSGFFSRGLTLLMTPVFTRLLTPGEYSIYPLYVSFMGIFTVIITLEISGSIIYSGLSKFRDRFPEGFTLSALISEAVLASVFAVLYIIFQRRINAITGLSFALTLMLIFQVFLNAATGIYYSEKRYTGDYKRVAFINIASGVATPILSLFLIRSNLGGISRVISPLIVTLIIGAPTVLSLAKNGSGKIRAYHFSYLLKTAIPLLPHYISLSVIAGGEKIIISRILGESALGKYSVAHSIGFSITMVFTALLTALTPKIADMLGRGDNIGVGKIFKISQGLTSILTLIFLTLSNEVFKIASPPEYYSAHIIIYPTALSALINFTTSLAASASISLGKEKKTMLASVLTALIFIPAAAILTRRIGFIGAAAAQLAATLARAALYLFILRKHTGKELVNINYYLQNLIFTFGFSILIFLLTPSPVSRILIALALIFILLGEVRRYKGIFQKQNGLAHPEA